MNRDTDEILESIERKSNDLAQNIDKLIEMIKEKDVRISILKTRIAILEDINIENNI